MSTSDNYAASRPIISLIQNESEDNNTKSECVRVDIKIQEVGCCGDVPKVSKANNKKRDKLLEWLKSSQVKREENNRQVFSRWIDMVDNGAIDLTALSNYPGKPSKLVNQLSSPGSTNNEMPLSQNSPVLPSTAKPATSNPSKPTAIVTTNVCPQYYSPISAPNYYGITPNWFATNQSSALYSPMSLAPQQPMGMYSSSYCTSSPMMNNYYQYLPVPQSCSMCPSYVIPSVPVTMDAGCNQLPINNQTLPSTENNSAINIDTNKWFQVLNEIKLKSDKSDDGSLPLDNRDYKDES